MKVSEIMSKYLHNINKQRQNSLVSFLHFVVSFFLVLFEVIDQNHYENCFCFYIYKSFL